MLGPVSPGVDLFPDHFSPAIGALLDVDLEQPRRSGVFAQQFAQPLGDRQRFVFALFTAGRHLHQTLLNSLLEPLVHRLLFLAAIAAAAEDECFFAAIGRRAQFDFQTVADCVPLLIQQLPLEFLEHPLRCAHDVTSLPCFEELDVLFAARLRRLVRGQRRFKDKNAFHTDRRLLTNLPWRPRSMTQIRFAFP